MTEKMKFKVYLEVEVDAEQIDDASIVEVYITDQLLREGVVGVLDIVAQETD